MAQVTVQLVVAGLLLGGLTGPAFAEERRQCPICIKANDQDASYPDKAGNTLARGILNAALGWTEVIRQPAKEAKEGGNIITGLANGVGQGITRTLTGLGEVFTFWTPKVDGAYFHLADDCPLDTTK